MQELQCLGFGPFRLDLRDERLWRGPEAIPLPPKTFAVLRCLVTQAGQLVTKEALLEAVWPETVVSEAVVTVAMRMLRRVLDDQVRTPRFIETVHGRGYRFIAPVSTLVAPGGPGRAETSRRVPSPTFRRPPHFVGRDAALAQLAQWWTTVRQGTRQVGIIAGEAGIGKTALVNTFVAQVAATEDVWVGHGQCLDHYGAGEAYLPLLEALGRLGREPEGEQLVAVLRQYETIRRAVPQSLRHIIEQQLHQVRPEDQNLLEAASLAGRTFSAAAVAAAVNQATEDIEARLTVLAHHGQFIQAGGLVAWPDGTVAAGYRFLHDLYCETLADRVPPSRQQRWHLQIGARKETGYGAQAHEIAAELAVHFEQGRDADRALRYLQYAADNALRRSAHADAITHLTKALALLTGLPETPERAQRELVVQTTLGPALMATRGYAASEVEYTYARARELCRQVGETPQLFQALWGLWYFSLVRAEFQTARELGEQLLQLAQRVQTPALLLLAHRVLGQTLAFLGEFSPAHVHLAREMTLYDLGQHRAFASLYGQDQGVICRSWTALTLWSLGYPEQARRRSREALTLAQELGHPFSLAYATCFAGLLCQLCRDSQATQERATAAIALCTEQGFALYLARGTILQGWAIAEQGWGAVGLAQMRQGLVAYQATGAAVFRPYYLAFLAEASGKVGQTGEGLTLLSEALAAVHKTAERFYEAELYRLKGELLLVRSAENHGKAETCFRQALTVARRQQARSWELRAATSLSRLWQHQGKRAAAYDLLAPVYGWFTEGFDTADLQEARALLEALGE